jgi:DNA-binding IclR family transcriptional regulator
LDDEENVMGIRAIAAPIFSRLGEVQACLIVRGPKSRMGDEVLQRIVPELRAAAKAISESFGHLPAA